MAFVRRSAIHARLEEFFALLTSDKDMPIQA